MNKTTTTIEDVVNHIYSDPFFKGFSSKFYNDEFLSEELFQEFLLIVLEKKDKMIELYDNKQLNYYSYTVIRNLACNKSSTFNKNHSSLNRTELHDNFESTNDDIYQNELKGLLEEIDEFLSNKVKEDSNFWYNKELFELYFFGNESYRSLSQQTKIPITSIFNSVTTTKKLINDHFSEKYNQTI